MSDETPVPTEVPEGGPQPKTYDDLTPEERAEVDSIQNAEAVPLLRNQIAYLENRVLNVGLELRAARREIARLMGELHKHEQDEASVSDEPEAATTE